MFGKDVVNEDWCIFRFASAALTYFNGGLHNITGKKCYDWCGIGRVMDGTSLNTLRPRQNGRHFADDIFKCISLNENVWIPIKISMKFVSKGLINNSPALVQIMAWRRPGDKPLSDPMMVSLTTHICVTRPQWVNWLRGWDPWLRFWLWDLVKQNSYAYLGHWNTSE